MARPQKEGLDYFPMDVDWDRKVKIFKAKYGLLGIGFLTTLLQTIYREGYYYHWDEDEKVLFSSEHNIEIELLDEMVAFAFQKEVFSQQLHFRYQILSSNGIQKRFYQTTYKRERVVFIEEYLLLEDLNRSNVVIVSLNDSYNWVSDTGNDTATGLPTPESTQRKEKKRKEKERREEKENSPLSNFDPQKLLTLYNFYLPSLNGIKYITPEHTEMITRIIKLYPEYLHYDKWKWYFEHVEKSKFLIGMKKSFKADFTWLVTPANFIKVLNGDYHDQEEKDYSHVADF